MAYNTKSNIKTKKKDKSEDGVAFTKRKLNPKYGEKWTPKNLKVYKNSVYNKISQLLLKNISILQKYGI